MGRAKTRAACRHVARSVATAAASHRFALWLAAPLVVGAFVASAAFLGFPHAAAQENQGQERLVLLDDEQIATTLSAIDTRGLITGSGLPKGLDLDSLRRIERTGSKVEPATGAAVTIDLVGGGRLSARSFSLSDERCRIAWKFGEALELPIEVVRVVHLEAGDVPPNVQHAIDNPSTDFDRMFMKTEEGLQTVTGLLEKLDDESAVVEWEGTRHTIHRASLHSVVLAQLQATTAAKPCRVTLLDGSVLPGAIEQLADGVLTMRVTGAAKIELPWSAVHAIDVRSSRMTYVSDLKPTSVSEEPVVTFGWNWQRDASVQGRPLTLAQRQFAKGIGVHANSQLTFDADEQYDELLAVVGIDSETDQRGDCVFEVLGDGASLWTQRVKGNDPPRPVRVDISGVRRVTLAVHAGADLDLADHADWCDVRFIKKP